jgi:hypothetical protein
MKHLHTALLTALLAGGAATAQAHQVWLENTHGQARLYFGEFNENLREASPGALDKFLGVPDVTQHTATAAQPLEGKLATGSFRYTAAANARTLFANPQYPLIDRSKRELPAMLYAPAARWVAGLTQAIEPNPQALDLVPTGQPGQFKVTYKGVPLPKVAVQMAAPSGWTREAHTAEDGTVSFELPWKGQYVAEVKHTDKNGGEAQGQKYGEASLVTTLSFVQKKGVTSPALPPAPAKAP